MPLLSSSSITLLSERRYFPFFLLGFAGLYSNFTRFLRSTAQFKSNVILSRAFWFSFTQNSACFCVAWTQVSLRVFTALTQLTVPGCTTLLVGVHVGCVSTWAAKLSSRWPALCKHIVRYGRDWKIPSKSDAVVSNTARGQFEYTNISHVDVRYKLDQRVQLNVAFQWV
jgi:hypothetical protein